MKEKLTNLFKKSISNDGTNSIDTEKEQKKKKILLFGGIGLGLFLLMNIFGSDEETIQNKVGDFKLTEADNTAKTNWIGTAGDDLGLAKKKIDTLTSKNEKLQEEVEKLTDALKDMNISQDNFMKTLKELNANSQIQMNNKNQINVDPLTNRDNFNQGNNKNLYTNFPRPNEDNNYGLSHRGEIPELDEVTSDRLTPLLDSLIYTNIAPMPEVKEIKKETQPKHLIPTGSVTKAVLLSGVDAPTMTQAKTNPLPILMRVVDTSILPNSWQYDIQDCFLVGEGYGDLTSERAYIRTNNLSCVLSNGEHIDMEFKGAVTGEDGKVGLKGAVVTKQGALLARTLIAGFLEGVGESFGQQDTTTITGSNGVVSTPIDQTAKKSFEQGLLKGLSSSAEKLADFYLKMADQISPVIEISAGREVNIITTEKLELKTLEQTIRDNKKE